MTRFVALLRGINVGGHNKLPMADLRALLESIGCEGVETYIQSGNVVFCHKQPADRISAAIEAAIADQFGYQIPVLVLASTTFAAIADNNPFAAENVEPNKVHVTFLAGPAADDAEDRLQEHKSATEQFSLTQQALYLCAPDGIARSRLAADAERCLATQATTRNWRTVLKLLDLLKSPQ